MPSYGMESVETFVGGIEVCANGRPEMKAGGVTFDWGTVAAVTGADVTLPDGQIIRIGEKYIRYGQVITKITKVETQVIDLSAGADPTAGTWDITDILGEELLELAWNITDAALQALVRALPVAFADEITVSKSGFQYTFTFPERIQNPTAMAVDFTDLTSATSVTVTTSTAGDPDSGKYGIYDAGASDGRQTLLQGTTFIVNKTVKETDLHSDHPPALEGGMVWTQRLLVGGSGPSFAALVAVMPRLRFADH